MGLLGLTLMVGTASATLDIQTLLGNNIMYIEKILTTDTWLPGGTWKVDISKAAIKLNISGTGVLRRNGDDYIILSWARSVDFATRTISGTLITPQNIETTTIANNAITSRQISTGVVTCNKIGIPGFNCTPGGGQSCPVNQVLQSISSTGALNCTGIIIGTSSGPNGCADGQNYTWDGTQWVCTTPAQSADDGSLWLISPSNSGDMYNKNLQEGKCEGFPEDTVYVYTYTTPVNPDVVNSLKAMWVNDCTCTSSSLNCNFYDVFANLTKHQKYIGETCLDGNVIYKITQTCTPPITVQNSVYVYQKWNSISGFIVTGINLWYSFTSWSSSYSQVYWPTMSSQLAAWSSCLVLTLGSSNWSYFTWWGLVPASLASYVAQYGNYGWNSSINTYWPGRKTCTPSPGGNVGVKTTTPKTTLHDMGTFLVSSGGVINTGKFVTYTGQYRYGYTNSTLNSIDVTWYPLCSCVWQAGVWSCDTSAWGILTASDYLTGRPQSTATAGAGGSTMQHGFWSSDIGNTCYVPDTTKTIYGWWKLSLFKKVGLCTAPTTSPTPAWGYNYILTTNQWPTTPIQFITTNTSTIPWFGWLLYNGAANYNYATGNYLGEWFRVQNGSTYYPYMLQIPAADLIAAWASCQYFLSGTVNGVTTAGMRWNYTTSTPLSCLSTTPIAPYSRDHIIYVTGGNVGIRTDNPQFNLDVNGIVRGASLQITSDERKKDNIIRIPDALGRLLGIHGYSYTLRKDGSPHYGVIAQEIDKLFPSIVSTDTQWYKAVRYNGLIGVVIEALHAIDKRITDNAQLLDDNDLMLETLEQDIHKIATEKLQ
jgi:Chaperone of endosialidase